MPPLTQAQEIKSIQDAGYIFKGEYTSDGYAIIYKRRRTDREVLGSTKVVTVYADEHMGYVSPNGNYININEYYSDREKLRFGGAFHIKFERKKNA